MAWTLDYFAYGSNMSYRRIVARIGWCEVIGVARLVGWRIAFNKRGRDGSSKCNAQRTGVNRDHLLGVIYRIDIEQRSVLDEIEGAGVGYSAHTARAHHGTARADVMLYVASPDYIDHDAAPFDWYLDFVLHGAREHGLPDEYVAQIAQAPTQPDPNPERRARNQQILSMSPQGLFTSTKSQ